MLHHFNGMKEATRQDDVGVDVAKDLGMGVRLRFSEKVVEERSAIFVGCDIGDMPDRQFARRLGGTLVFAEK